jgi:adenosylcobinamide-phosphate synthase
MALNWAELWALLAPDPWLLLAAVALDGLIGDPVYTWHPVRLGGMALSAIEKVLRRMGLDGYGGGMVLALFLSCICIGAMTIGMAFNAALWPPLAWVFHLFLLYSLIALKDLCRHGLAIDSAADVAGARRAVSMLVGRDTRAMDLDACRRAGMESLSENAVDGFVSPVFFYVVGGLPGIVFFKVVSTMDSMVGNKTPLYLRFGWCGARLDDLLNYVPARLSYVLMVLVAWVLPGYSALKALRVGWHQHGLVPGPNSGWSEAATAGALQCRLVGPIHQAGRLVTEVWLGDAADPPGGQVGDIARTCFFVSLTCLVAVGLAVLVLYWRGGQL